MYAYGSVCIYILVSACIYRVIDDPLCMCIWGSVCKFAFMYIY